MNDLVLAGLGGRATDAGKKWIKSNSFDDLDCAAIFKLFSRRHILLKVCSGMDISILMRSADFLAALFLKMRHEAAHEASLETSYSHCLVVLFSSGCIMQLIRSHHGALCKQLIFSFNFFLIGFVDFKKLVIKDLIGSLFPGIKQVDFDEARKSIDEECASVLKN